jgi:hypothetical protein
MMFLTKTNGYLKMCDTNKNVTKMGLSIKGVCCSSCPGRSSENICNSSEGAQRKRKTG